MPIDVSTIVGMWSKRPMTAADSVIRRISAPSG